MNCNHNRVIFHIDVNSAFLSWEAVYRLQHGESIDLREIPSVVGGDPESRHGIVLAKSIPAKKYNIETGESIYTAKKKCPDLMVVPPRHDLYVMYSNDMMDILREYTDTIQRFSIDECFLDFTFMENLYNNPIKLAYEIKDRIKNDLGFTVSIGVSSNKLLAKMGSDLKKPDAVTTLYPAEIKDKMWPLKVEDLFMVGKATVPKLNKLNIYTIGDLAKCDLEIIKTTFKSYGIMIWNYANGIESSEVVSSSNIKMKSIGNSTTTASDVKDREAAHKVILSLVETVAGRLRNSKNYCKLVSVGLKTKDFNYYSRQRKLSYATDSTTKIAAIACELFDEVWKGEPLRLIGVSVAELCSNELHQISLFEEKDNEKNRALDSVIDDIRMKHGDKSVFRAVFLEKQNHLE